MELNTTLLFKKISINVKVYDELQNLYAIIEVIRYQDNKKVYTDGLSFDDMLNIHSALRCGDTYNKYTTIIEINSNLSGNTLLFKCGEDKIVVELNQVETFKFKELIRILTERLI